MSTLSYNETQHRVFRGCARLKRALQATLRCEDAQRSWHQNIVKEATDTFKFVTRWNGTPAEDLIVPPLPLAIMEVHRLLTEKGMVMRPSDIHSPFDQAGTSPFALLYITEEDDAKVPQDIDLGDPASFWWNKLDAQAEKTTASVAPPLPEHIPTTTTTTSKGEHRNSTMKASISSAGLGKKRPKMFSSDEDEVDQLDSSGGATSIFGIRLSKRHRKGSPSNLDSSDLNNLNDSSDSYSGSGEARYVCKPKCQRCRDESLVCYVEHPRHQHTTRRRCIPCKTSKVRCTAMHTEHQIIKMDPAAIRQDSSESDHWDSDPSASDDEPVSARLRPRKAVSVPSGHEARCGFLPEFASRQDSLDSDDWDLDLSASGDEPVPARLRPRRLASMPSRHEARRGFLPELASTRGNVQPALYSTAARPFHTYNLRSRMSYRPTNDDRSTLSQESKHTHPKNSKHVHRVDKAVGMDGPQQPTSGTSAQEQTVSRIDQSVQVEMDGQSSREQQERRVKAVASLRQAHDFLEVLARAVTDFKAELSSLHELVQLQ